MVSDSDSLALLALLLNGDLCLGFCLLSFFFPVYLFASLLIFFKPAVFLSMTSPFAGGTGVSAFPLDVCLPAYLAFPVCSFPCPSYGVFSAPAR